MSHTYNEISNYISNKDYGFAENKLNEMTTHDDKWHYFYALILIQKAWFDSAKSHLEKAISLNPDKVLYKNTLAKFMRRSRSYSNDYYNTPHYRRRSGCCCCCDDCCCQFDCCDLICADTCCECMGGDLISCI